MNFRDYVIRLLGLRGERQQVTPKNRKMKSTNSDKFSRDDSNAIFFINKIFIIATWFMVIASCLLLVAIIIFGFIGKEAPSILSQLLLVMIGYIGGVIASYVRFATPGKKGK